MPTFVAIDVETANPRMQSICQVGVATFRGGEVVDRWSSLVDPQDYFDAANIAVHGINEIAVTGAPTFSEIVPELERQLAGMIVVAHTGFDRVAITRAFQSCDARPFQCTWLDSAKVARRAWPAVSKKGYGLSNLALMLGIQFRHHDALEDATTAGMVIVRAVQESGKPLDWWLSRVEGRLPKADGSFVAPVAQHGDPEGPLAGEAVTFTGELSMPRSHAAKLAASAGCDVTEGVSKKTTILIVGDQDITKLAGKHKSSKHLKAESLISQGIDIRIIGESDFLAMLSNTENAGIQ